MSFFKRIIGLFREEIDEEVEQPVELLQQKEVTLQRTVDQPDFSLSSERLQESQEMKTRIAYRYPSRELRGRRQEAIQPRRERKVRLEKQDFLGNSPEQEHRSVKKEEPRPKQPTKPIPTYKVSPGPFKPTEVPSPIYGFQKRPKNKAEDMEEPYDQVEVTPVAAREEESLPVSKEKAEAETIKIDKEEKVIFTAADSAKQEEPAPTLPEKEEPLLLFKSEEKKKAFDVEAVSSFAKEEIAVTSTKPEYKEEEIAAKPAESVYEEEVAAKPAESVYEEEVAAKPAESVYEEEVAAKPAESVYKEEITARPAEPVYKEKITARPAESGYEEEVAARPVEKVYKEKITARPAESGYEEEVAARPVEKVYKEEAAARLAELASKEEKVAMRPAESVHKGEEVAAGPVEPVHKEEVAAEPAESVYKEEEAAARPVELVYEEEEEVAAKPADLIYKEEPAAPMVEERAVQVEITEKPAPPENPDGKLPEEKRVSRAEERSRKRKQTPFNVLMLKQDRELWKQRKEEPSKLPEEPAVAEASDVICRVEERVEDTLLQPTEPEVPAADSEDRSEPEYYVFPYEDYLAPPVVKEMSGEFVDAQSEVLNETFKNFNVKASVVNVTVGPSVTRFEVEPERGVKVSKITNLTDDIKRSLAARNIRIEAPIPGTQVIGIEVPNKESRPVQISEIISSQAFKENASPLTSALGLDISGEPVVLDLKKMPHGLIAGATGSGKSVCINSILVSLLYKAAPHELKLMLIDPKMVELAPYNGIPHLVSPVITDVKAATAALKWAVEEMERRYELFVHAGVRDITKYNEKAAEHGRKSEHLPYIVIIIDELADLMMMSPADVEEAICRIAQKARACGIHLIVATQRPSVDVITGLIKANIPTRIAFSVSSQVDSRTIIDTGGAEKLLGRGDMLFLNNGASETVRLQGTFVSDDEIDTIVAHVRKEQAPNYLFEQEELLQKAAISETEDELFPEACEFVVQQGGASTSLLQRHFKIGYNRAARLIEMMETQGFVSGQRAGRPREVLLTEEELQTLHDSNVN
ncbi:DNA translocase FtsK [Pseudobacillus wudalianchiensis]|uniref:FtsK domain-containing protein n=1 Tax=Pseudobacillus wudalianchiensis TaxID=1743143 RepID=A0A1B9B7Y3_9BACI|nr:DNA translocase FtsK [Bacillus wudalianchiensis]OCA92217.1 hypothetical protein A8F95_00360 [Bacillus wudalianchiensis]